MIPKPQKIKDPAKYADFDLPREKLEYALAEALKKIDIGVASFTPESYPSATSKDYVYTRHGNTGWGSGFWPGMVWLAYEQGDWPGPGDLGQLRRNGPPVPLWRLVRAAGC